MDTHSFIPGMREGRKGIGLPALSILIAAIMAAQLLLPSVASAHSTFNLASGSPPLSTTGLQNLVGVSVVRIVTIYGNPNRPQTTPVQCTGLGALVGSWPSSPAPSAPYRNWVLTDGALLSPTANADCTQGAALSLLGIQVLASDEYTNTTHTFALIAGLGCTPRNTTPPTSACSDGTPGSSEKIDFSTSNGTAPVGALFSFATDSQHPQPYLTFDTNAATDVGKGFGLVNKTASPPPSKLSATPVAGSTPVPGVIPGVESFLTPALVISNGTPSGAPLSPTLEGGTPLVSDNGLLVAMRLSHSIVLSSQDIKMLLQKEPDFSATGPAARVPAPNLLKNGWDTALTAFDARQYAAAHLAFQPILTLNPNFQAAKTFDTQAVQLSGQPSGKSTPPPGNTGGQSTGSSTTSWLLIIGLGAAFILVILLLVLVTIITGRRRRELARFAEEQKEAQRIAEREVQRQRQAQQGQQGQPGQRSKATAHLQAVPGDMRCPNCNTSVQPSDAICPHCHYPLSPSASGVSMRLPGNGPVVATHTNNVQVPPSSPAPGAMPSISDMPTAAISPFNNQQPAASHDSDLEKTVPYNVQQMRGRNLSLAVGTRSDPGIKRKHKPNEDSLFAVQGARTYDSSPQQFGLFVVADGMGGHASGQEASRLAIQTMIDFMLPKIAENAPLDDNGFQRLLGDGVQHANQAVHQRNMDAHADMGTTMTTALVIGATAYVANVGDSRTYLYREPQGLTKVTNDHSVVASLVEAGIIKPDDIYTHPKRNQIYRSLGEKPVVEVDTFSVALQPGDKLLLCSDGLWDMVRDPEIQRVMSMPTSNPNKTGQELVKAALNGGGEDNVSVIVVEIAESSERTGITGIHLLEKPESVTVPDLPTM